MGGEHFFFSWFLGIKRRGWVEMEITMEGGKGRLIFEFFLFFGIRGRRSLGRKENFRGGGWEKGIFILG